MIWNTKTQNVSRLIGVAMGIVLLGMLSPERAVAVNQFLVHKNGAWIQEDNLADALTTLGTTSSSPGVIYLPASTTPIQHTGTINLYNNQALIGAGSDATIIGEANVQGGEDVDIITCLGDNVLIQKLSLIRGADHIVANTDGDGINLNGKSAIRIRNVVIENNRYGIFSSTATTVTNIQGTVIRFSRLAAIGLDDAQNADIFIGESEISYSGGDGIQYKGQTGQSQFGLVRIENCRIRWCAGSGVDFEGRNLYMSGTQILHTKADGVTLTGASDVKLTNNQITYSGYDVDLPSFEWQDGFTTSVTELSRVLADGIEVDRTSHDIDISNNYIALATQHGIHLTGAQTAPGGPTNITITNNVLSNANQMKDGTLGAGIAVLSPAPIGATTYPIDHIRIRGNRIFNDAAFAALVPAARDQTMGLWTTGNTDYIIVSENDLSDDDFTIPLLNAAESTTMIFSNNFMN